MKSIKSEKQRLQWRQNQQKCRERKRQRLHTLEESILRMKERIMYLEKLKAISVNALESSKPLMIATNQLNYRFELLKTYYTLFQHVLSYEKSYLSPALQPSLCPYCYQTRQYDKLYAIENTPIKMQTKILTFVEHFFHLNVNYHSKGIQSFWDQWYAFSQLFEQYHYEPIEHTVLYDYVDENDRNRQCLIRTTWRFYMVMSLKTIQYLMPSLSYDYYPFLVGKTLVLDGFSNYYFQGTKIIRVEGERQMIPCFVKALNGNLKLAIELFGNQQPINENGMIEGKVLYKLLKKE